MRTVLLLLLVTATSTACGDRKHDDSATPSPAADKVAAEPEPEPVLHAHRKSPPRTGDPRPQPKLTASIDGKPVEMKAAFAWTQPSGAIELLVTSVPATCDWATADMRRLEDGEEDFSAIVHRMLQPDGSFAWAIQQVSYGANTSVGMGGGPPMTVTGDATPGQSTAITLAFSQASSGFGDDPVKTLKVDGTIDALGCPPPASASIPPPPAAPAQAATMTVAGQKLPIASAMIQQTASGDRTIILSSGGVSCDGWPSSDHATVAVTLHYHAPATDPEVRQADLTGDWIGGQKADQVFAGGKLVATPTTVPAGVTSVDVTLSGKTSIMDYPVTLDGKVAAQVCPEH
jgi:hypothetical protein